MEIAFFLAVYGPTLLAGLAVAMLLSCVLVLRLVRPCNRPPTWRRLLLGYGCVGITVLVVTACIILVAGRQAGIDHSLTPERRPVAYWAVFHLFAIIAVYASLLGVAIIGAPVTFILIRLGLGSVLGVLGAASLVSFLVAALLCGVMRLPIEGSLIFVGMTLTAALAFSLGLGLPMRHGRHHLPMPKQ